MSTQEVERIAIIETRLEALTMDGARLESKIDHITETLNSLNTNYVEHKIEMKVFRWVASISGGTVLTAIMFKLVALIIL